MLPKKISIAIRLSRQIGWLSTIHLLVRRTAGISAPFKVRIPQLLHPIFIRPQSDDLWVMLQVFDDGEYKPASTLSLNNILDLGGNCGFTAIYFATLFPRATIVTVEPDSDNFSVLMKNISPYPSITAIQAAAWSNDCDLHLKNPSANSSSKSFENVTSGIPITKNIVSAFSIRTLSEKSLISNWDLIKIDVEGAEVELLSTASDWVGLTNGIAVEIHKFCELEALPLLNQATTEWKSRYVSNETSWCFRDSAELSRK